MKRKCFMRIIFLAVMLSSIGFNANASYDFRVNNIYYNILSSDDRTVEVTNNGYYNSYTSSSVTIPQKVIYNSVTYTVTAIGSKAFYKCSSLTSVKLPSSVTSIGDYAFSYCSSLTTINVDEDNQTYASVDGVVYTKDVTKLCICPAGKTSVSIPNTVTTISSYAFNECSSLASVEMPNVTTISSYAFYYCSSLASVEMPNVTSIGSKAFYYCSSLASVEMPNVTSIGSMAFNLCRSLTSVEMPNVTSIGSYAFSSCSSLASVELPSSVTTIGSYTFSSCSSLASVEMPNVTSIGDHAFYNCSSLTSVEMPNVTTIGESAFDLCRSLTSVEMPNVTSIGSDAFYYCDSLAPVVEMPSITTIGSMAFYNCSSLTSVEMGNNITEIGSEAFADCNSLKVYCESTTPPSATNGVFSNKTLQYGTLYVPVGSKGDYESVDPWRNFWNIEEMEFSGVVNAAYDFEVDGIYYNIISSGDNIISSGDNIFLSDDRVEVTNMYGGYTVSNSVNSYSGSVTIPQEVLYDNVAYTVTSIGDYAFYCCSSLTYVELPCSVASIGDYAFYCCNSLIEIYCESTTPPSASNNTFSNDTYQNATLYVPVGSKGDYEVADPWCNFWNIEEMEFSGVENVIAESDDITVTTVGGTIVVGGLEAGRIVEVYSINGQRAYHGTDNVIGNLGRGAYIVKAGSKTVKILL